MTSQKTTSSNNLNWVNILFLTLTPLAALIFTPIYIYNHGWSWGHTIFLIVTYVISNMSITCGYHRYFSHRSYDVSPLIHWLYVIVGAGAFQGSVYTWSVDHRRHHRMVDTDNDPYSINKGFWYAHIGWMLVNDDAIKHANLRAPDLEKDRLVMWQHRYYPWIATFMGFFVPGFIAMALGFGFWGGVIIGGALRITLSQHSTFFINSACHYFGGQPYTDKNTARDSFILAFLTFGEGYHNYHHLFQADYRNGVRWFHYDPTKWWIRSLAFLGLADRLKRVNKEEILKARMQQEERILIARGASQEMVGALKAKVEEAQIKWRHLRDEYQRLKAEMKKSVAYNVSHSAAAIKFEELKTEAKIARQEFNQAYRQWRYCRRAYATVRI